ncbi:MAG: hypothetical protein JST54_30470 [Deltaproteobacteria bacterium]|nr:hypothetical protein [Deltaproteobacteria bacterium]
MILIVGANLMFASKILETARALGLSAAQAAPDSAELGNAKLVLLDLEKLGADGVRALRERTKARLVGYASHVADDALSAARAAGCDEVLTRGQFSARLPQLLSGATA